MSVDRIEKIDEMLETALADGEPAWLQANYAIQLRYLERKGEDPKVLAAYKNFPDLMQQQFDYVDTLEIAGMQQAIVRRAVQTEKDMRMDFTAEQLPAVLVHALNPLYPPGKSAEQER